MIIQSHEPTLAELEDQHPEASIDCDGTIECLQEELDNIRFLRRVLDTRENGVRKQLAQLQDKPAIVVQANVELIVEPVHIFNGSSEPACPDCTEADGL